MKIADIKKLDMELRAMVADERKGLVAFLRRLDVLDRERAYCEFNCGSTWEYLTRKLHLCEGTAWGRVNAMRYLRSFPQLAGALESGRLNLSQLKIIGPLLTAANADGLIARAANLSKLKTQELAVSVQPRVVPADGVRKLPAAVATPSPMTPQPDAPFEPSPETGFVLSAPVVLSRPPDRGSIEPVAKDEFQFRAHMDHETKRLLDQLAEVVSHAVPDRAPAKLLAMMVRDSLEVQRRKRGLVKPTRAGRPAPEKEATPGIRQPVVAEVRRRVLERDGHQCTFASHDGERCPVTEGLEMDHLDGALVSGSSTVDELRARCRPHNHYLATLKLGRAFMERKMAEARDATTPRRVAGEPVAAYAARRRPFPRLAADHAEVGVRHRLAPGARTGAG